MEAAGPSVESVEETVKSLSISQKNDFFIPRMYSRTIDRTVLHLYNVRSNNGEEIEDLESGREYLCAKFCPMHEELLTAGNECGIAALVDFTGFENDNTKKISKKNFEVDNYGVCDIDWMITLVGQCVFVAGSSSGNIYKYHINSENRKGTKMWTCFNDIPVTCIATYPPCPALMLAGHEDGRICNWNETEEIVVPYLTQKCAHPSAVQKPSEQDNAITCLFLKSEDVLLSAGKGNNFIQMWDPSKLDAPLKSFHAKAVVTSITMHRNNICRAVSDLFYASCMDNHIYCYNLESKFKCSEPLYSFVGHQVNSLYVKISVSRCGNYLASGSSDGYVYLWSTNLALANMKEKEAEDELPQVLPLAKLDGHLGEEVTAVDWSYLKDKVMFVSVGDDHSFRVWHVKKSEQTNEPAEEDPEHENTAGKVEIIDKTFAQRLMESCKLKAHETANIVERKSSKIVMETLNKIQYPTPKKQSMEDDEFMESSGMECPMQ